MNLDGVSLVLLDHLFSLMFPVLLEAIHLPKKQAIVPCPGHQKGQDVIAKGNQMAHLSAKQAVQGATILTIQKQPKTLKAISFNHTPEDLKAIEGLQLAAE